MNADIVERISVELVAANKIGAPDLASVLRDAANALADRDAEIVRLRGEAESMEQMARMQAARADAAEREVTHLRSIASAEAKGDAPQRCKECMHTTFERRHDGSHICVHCKSIAPQPAEAKTPAPAMPNGVEGLPQPFGYVEPRHDLSGYEVFDEPGPRRAAIWNLHGMQQALAQQPAACPKCGGTGEADSGGIMPWGAPAMIPCDCQQPAADQFIATFRCENNGIVGTTDAKVHSVTRHDDGRIEVVIDHWPEQPAAVDEAMARRYLDAQAAYITKVDAAFGRQIAGALHSDDVVAACMAGLTAALAAQPGGAE